MDVLERKFDLPLTIKEQLEKESNARINIKTQDIAKIEGMDDIQTENTQIISPALVVEPSEDQPHKRVEFEEVSKTSNPELEEEEEIPVLEEEEDEVTKNLPQFQFRKLTTLPDGLINMPGHAGEIEMMAQGQGIKGLAPQKGWVKAWAFLSDFDALSGSKYLVKGKARRYDNINLGKIIASDATTIQEWINDDWNEIRSSAGRPFFWDNVLYAVNIGNTGNSIPIERYDFDGSAWSGYGGYLDISTDVVIDCCIRNDRIYLATTYHVYEYNSSWSVYATTTDPITAITTDGSYPYIVTVASGAVKLYKLAGGSPSLISTVESSGYSDASLDYVSNTSYLYVGVVDSGTGKTTKIYEITTNGTKSTLMTGSWDNTICPASAVSSEEYGYIGVGKELYRLDDGTNQVYDADNEIGYLSGLEEQISMGGQLEVFHTEWEGTLDVRGATTAGDTKFDLGGGS